jgi:ABC-type Fe3+-siderophore transport system permease subunit
MGSYQRHAKAFAFGGIAAAVIALITAIVIGKRPGYEIPVFAFIAGGIAMMVSIALTWWGGRLGIGRAEIFLGIGLALVALAGVCVGIFGPI